MVLPPRKDSRSERKPGDLSKTPRRGLGHRDIATKTRLGWREKSRQVAVNIHRRKIGDSTTVSISQ